MHISVRVVALLYLSAILLAGVPFALLERGRLQVGLTPHVYFSIFAVVLFLILFGLGAAVLVRLLQRVGPIPSAEFPLRDRIGQRWIIIKTLSEIGQWALAPFTLVFFKPVLYSLFGAKIGRRTAIAGDLVDPYLTEIGDDAVIGQNAVLSPHLLMGGRLTLGRIRLEPETTVGVGAVLQGNVIVGRGSIVAANAVVLNGTRIPPFELWGGAPACKIKNLPPPSETPQ
jgi:acetyltransferase-like isoleucine patch superfamily enzyme